MTDYGNNMTVSLGLCWSQDQHLSLFSFCHHTATSFEWGETALKSEEKHEFVTVSMTYKLFGCA